MCFIIVEILRVLIIMLWFVRSLYDAVYFITISFCPIKSYSFSVIFLFL